MLLLPTTDKFQKNFSVFSQNWALRRLGDSALWLPGRTERPQLNNDVAFLIIAFITSLRSNWPTGILFKSHFSQISRLLGSSHSLPPLQSVSALQFCILSRQTSCGSARLLISVTTSSLASESATSNSVSPWTTPRLRIVSSWTRPVSILRFRPMTISI